MVSRWVVAAANGGKLSCSTILRMQRSTTDGTSRLKETRKLTGAGEPQLYDDVVALLSRSQGA